MKDRVITVIVVSLIVMLTATEAFAGPMTGVVNYVENNLVADVETLAIIAIAIILFSMHVNWWMIIGICAGIWILANPSTLVSAFSAG
jgi:hypothetical protein